MTMLFFSSVVLAALSILALGFGLVRLIISRLRPATAASTEPPRITWTSPIVIIPVALMALCTAILVAFYALSVTCFLGFC